MNLHYPAILALLLAGCAPVPFTSAEGPEPHTWEEVRYAGVVRQELDYTCGFASLATILRYHFDEDVSERDIRDAFFSWLPSAEARARVERDGASLEQLFWFSKRQLGWRAYISREDTTKKENVYRATSGGRPALVYVEPDGFRHFAVLRGVIGQTVFLADPARGNLRMSLADFEKEWVGQWALFLERPGFVPTQDVLSIRGVRLEAPALSELKRSMIF